MTEPYSPIRSFCMTLPEGRTWRPQVIFNPVCDRSREPGHMMIGDAFPSIDPVFSSGAMLAMQGAPLAR